jgi:hypothetical protein
MIILNYILATCLVILSVVKTADLFIKSDQSLRTLQTKFTKTTKDLISSEKGSISLTAALLSVILCSLLFFYITKMKIEYAESKYRKDSYLCSRYLNVQTIKYIKEMSVFNWSLRSAYAAKSTIVNGVSGEILWRAITTARNFRHLIYIKKLVANKYCQINESRSYLSNLPFKNTSSLKLETNIDETTIVRENKWTSTFYKNPNGIRLKNSFCIKTIFLIKNAFLPRPSFQSNEISIGGLSNLKCLYGSSS